MRISRYTPLIVVLAALTVLLPSCEWDGNFCILGYTTKPPYATNIRTVYVPIFKNLTFMRGLEFDLTRAVVREIEAKTPYKVISDCERADTELGGTIVRYEKRLLNMTRLNEVREAETTLAVHVYWRDLRTGESLCRPRPEDAPAPIDRALVKTLGPAPIVGVESVSGFIPELGESLATAEKKNVDRLAIQIVSMMEKPW